MQALYGELARYYDRFYWWKDYKKEVDFLVELFNRYGVNVHDILEVACGTGSHSKLLSSRGFRVTGLDINGDMLRVAEEKLGRRARFVKGDMQDLRAAVPEASYDAVVCLFSSICYNRTSAELTRSVRGMYRSAKPGGLVIFDTHFLRRTFLDGYRGEDIFDDGDVMGARLSISKRRGNQGEISFSYLIYDSPRTIQLRNDVHRFGLFDREDLVRAMRASGLERVSVFTDWSLGKSSPGEFKDYIFVGRRPPIRQPT
ncbi:MAG: class I SAM-dependent methyltransferase [Thaumarchaeota archaeon]|nr:class I SAM-dependent methyltransferase [Nitrososphaerota archaeon]